ncbi:hypothetical protein MUP77_15170 [Candidatus Bathyarchaeota archaeon]|nr:hypothetical protein [Candidatus Bathyarchaeota archaeon]
MLFETIKVDCECGAYRIIHYHLSLGDPLLEDALKRGAELAGKVNINDPSGVPRDAATRVAKCSGGIIAEKIFHDFFDQEISRRVTTELKLSKIEFFVPIADISKGQIDFIIKSKANNTTILKGETRSSFSYITESIENVVRYAMGLLGPYVTTHKPSEQTKDIHVTVIHRVDPAKLLTEVKVKGIDSYIVGGGTKQMFEDSKLTKIDDLYQLGAKYLIIKPMWKGLDAYGILDNIFDRV